MPHTMAKHYLICALWASTREDGEPLDSYFDITDVAEESVRQAEADCDAFRAQAGDALAEWSDEQAGHDLWLTRNGHGTGFWDRDFGTEAQREALSAIARLMGNCDAIVGDDGKVWIE